VPPSTILGYTTRAVVQPLEPFTYESPKLGGHDARISVTQCGVCHTDIHAIDDYYGITTSPFVPGHEIVGYIATVSREASGLKEGGRVGIIGVGGLGHLTLQFARALDYEVTAISSSPEKKEPALASITIRDG